jgi:hypothetical protein
MIPQKPEVAAAVKSSLWGRFRWGFSDGYQMLSSGEYYGGALHG